MRKYRDPAKQAEDLRRLGLTTIQAEAAQTDDAGEPETQLDPRLGTGITEVANNTGQPELVEQPTVDTPATTSNRRSPRV